MAHETGHTYVDELEFDTRDEALFDRVLKRDNIVVHCPGMCYAIERYSADDVLIVMMIRPIADIIASEHRVRWIHGAYYEFEAYGIERQKARTARRYGAQISMIKYERWFAYQKHQIEHYLQLEYNSLEGHPLWLPREKRRQFSPGQTHGN